MKIPGEGQVGGPTSTVGKSFWKASGRGGGEGASNEEGEGMLKWIKLISDLSYRLILFSCAND